MDYHAYDPDRDLEAVLRIWDEAGWNEPGAEDWLRLALAELPTIVAKLNGEAECCVITSPGDLQYLDERLPFSCIHAVATSRVARQQGLAARLTARAIANSVREGALVCGLGMFDQGYYNRLGFGTGNYDCGVDFDPAQLTVDVKPRPPSRLTADDWESVHASRLARRRAHGSLSLTPSVNTRGDIAVNAKHNGFGLGYLDGPQGELTHHFWFHGSRVGGGIYEESWTAFQTPEQFLELMALLHSLSDHVHLVKMTEPPGIQLYDLLERPHRQRRVREGGAFPVGVRAVPWWQMRLCDLPGCLALTHLPCDDLRFSLRLDDPLARYLSDDDGWHGAGGDYVVTLGAESSARPGLDAALATLTASVGALTRLWLGVRPATGLAVTDGLSGPPELLRALDRTLSLPPPRPDWFM